MKTLDRRARRPDRLAARRAGTRQGRASAPTGSPRAATAAGTRRSPTAPSRNTASTSRSSAGGPQVNNRPMLPAGQIDFLMAGNLLLSFDNVRNEHPDHRRRRLLPEGPADPDGPRGRLRGLRRSDDRAEDPDQPRRPDQLLAMAGQGARLQGRAAPPLFLQPRRVPDRQDRRPAGLRHLRAALRRQGRRRRPRASCSPTTAGTPIPPPSRPAPRWSPRTPTSSSASSTPRSSAGTTTSTATPRSATRRSSRPTPNTPMELLTEEIAAMKALGIVDAGAVAGEGHRRDRPRPGRGLLRPRGRRPASSRRARSTPRKVATDQFVNKGVGLDLRKDADRRVAPCASCSSPPIPAPTASGPRLAPRRRRGPLTAAGHELRVRDLYAEGFDPVMRDAEWRAYFEDPSVDARPLHADHVADLRWAEGLVLVYPTWWYGPPVDPQGLVRAGLAARRHLRGAEDAARPGHAQARQHPALRRRHHLRLALVVAAADPRPGAQPVPARHAADVPPALPLRLAPAPRDEPRDAPPTATGFSPGDRDAAGDPRMTGAARRSPATAPGPGAATSCSCPA